MQVPTGQGLGVNLDRDKLARAQEVYQKCGMRGRDDRSLMRRLDVPATARASFYVYNTEADVEALVAGVEHARAVFG